MKTVCLRFTTFFAVALIAVALSAQDDQPPFNQDPGGGGGTGGSCATCAMDDYRGFVWLRCASPNSGQWGAANCRIESYPEGSYCLLDGNQCCVD